MSSLKSDSDVHVRVVWLVEVLVTRRLKEADSIR